MKLVAHLLDLIAPRILTAAVAIAIVSGMRASDAPPPAQFHAPLATLTALDTGLAVLSADTIGSRIR